MLRGAHSALFGSDAMASVIQLFSVRPEIGRPQLNFTVDGGTYDTAHFAGGVGARNGGIEYSVFGSYLHTDNREPNNDNKSSTVSGLVAHSMRIGWVRPLSGTRRIRHGQAPLVPPHSAVQTWTRSSATRDGSVLRADGINPSDRASTQQTSYAYIITKFRSTNLLADPPYTPRFGDLVAAFPSSDFLFDSETELGRHHFEYRADAVVGRNQTLTAAFAYDGERGVLTNHRSTATPQTPERNNTGTTVQYEASMSRVSHRRRHPVRKQRQLRFLCRAAGGGVVAGRVRATDTWGRTRLRGSVGRGIKEPLFIQSYSQSPNFLGNPDLKPERSRGFDLGFEQRFAGDRVGVEATYFANHFDNLISLGPSDPITSMRNTKTSARPALRVWSSSGSALVDGGFRIGGAYTFLDSKVVRSISSSPIFAPGRHLYRRPRHSGSLQASYTRERLLLALGGVFIGERVDSDFNFPSVTSNEGYATWNASAEVRFARRTAVFLTIDNLADREYMEPLGYRGLGRVVRFGIRARF